MRVAILDDIHNAYDRQPAVARLRERADVTILTAPIKSPADLQGIEVVIANRERTRFTRELLEQLPDLKTIVQTGAHAYHIDFAVAEERGITLIRAQSGPSTGAAELTIGLMLDLMRHISRADAAMKRGDWPAPLGFSLGGKTLGIIGLGSVGRSVARLAAPFGMRILAWSRSLTAERAAEAGAELADYDRLLRESDVVTVQVGLSESSRNLVGARELALMKSTAYLINTSRGPIVNESALIEALQKGTIAGAALDVFDQEPLPADHPLRSLSNVTLTPHLGWPTDSAYERFANATVTALLDYLDGKPVLSFDH